MSLQQKQARTSPIESMAEAPASVRSLPNGSHTSAEPMRGLSKRGQQLVASKTFGVYSRARVSGEAS